MPRAARGLLIEAFSRLVWRATNGKFARRELVGLYSQLWESTSTAELLASPCSAFSWQLSSSTSSRSAMTRDLKFDPVDSITPYWQIQSGRICSLRSQADLSTPWSGILHGLREEGMQRRKPKRFRYIDAPSETEPRLGIPATLSSRPPWPRCRSVRTGRLHRPGT